MPNKNFQFCSPEQRAKFIQNLHKHFKVKGIQVSSNEGQHLSSREESTCNCKIEKYIANFKQFFPQEQLSPIIS